MADLDGKTLLDLPALTELDGSEQTYVTKGGTDYRAPVSLVGSADVTEAAVINALGFTPYNAAINPSNFITTSGARAAVSGSSTVTYSVGSGAFSLTGGNVTTALGFTPYNATNPAGYITDADVRGELSAINGVTYDSGTGVFALSPIAAGTVLANTTGGSAAPIATTYAALKTALALNNVDNKSSATIRSEITSGNVTTALGFTPYNATNPAGYITTVDARAAVSGSSTVTYNGSTGVFSVTSGNVAAALGYAPASAPALIASTGAALVSTAQNNVNAATRTLQDKGRERISLSDFTGATDSIKLQRAINFAATRGGEWDVQIDGAFTVAGVSGAANVRLIGGQLTAVSGADRIIDVPSSADNFRVEMVVFDGLLLEDTGSPNLVAACILQDPGAARSTNVAFIRNRFKVRSNNGAAYSAMLLNNSSGEAAGNYCDQSGGDIYNFNGGFWNVHHNTAMNGGDGGVAFNNGAAGIVDSNYMYKCVLGIGSGPNGTTASPYCNVEFVNNVAEACDLGINCGWFAYAGREGPQYAKIANNKIIRPKSYGIRYDGRASTPYMDAQIESNQVILAGSNAYDGSTGVGQSIVVTSGSGTRVTNNQAAGGLGSAYYFDNNLDLVFAGNSARNNGGYGAQWLGTNTVLMGDFYETGSTLGRFSGTPTIISGPAPDYTGTTSGAGTFTVVHNLGVPGIKRLAAPPTAMVLDASNVEYPMTLSYIDGTNFVFTSAINSRPAVCNWAMKTRATTGF